MSISAFALRGDGARVRRIAQTGGDLTPCNRVHLETVKRVRDGIRDAGGIAGVIRSVDDAAELLEGKRDERETEKG